jgi:hypothetical protein
VKVWRTYDASSLVVWKTKARLNPRTHLTRVCYTSWRKGVSHFYGFKVQNTDERHPAPPNRTPTRSRSQEGGCERNGTTRPSGRGIASIMRKCVSPSSFTVPLITSIRIHRIQTTEHQRISRWLPARPHTLEKLQMIRNNSCKCDDNSIGFKEG